MAQGYHTKVLRFAIFALLLTLLCAGVPVALRAQQADSPATSAAAQDAQALKSPKAAMDTFLSNMNAELSGDQGRWRTAIKALDLSDVSSIGFDTIARNTALEFYEALNRTGYINVSEIPDSFDGSRYVWKKLNSGPIAMERDAQGRWHFTAATVARTRDFLAELPALDGSDSRIPTTTFVDSPYIWLQNHLPKWMFRRAFILQNFQWIGILLVIFVGVIVDRFTRFSLRKVTRRQLVQRSLDFDSEHLDATAKWVGICFAGCIWLVGLILLGLPDGLVVILRLAAVLVTVVAGVLAAFRIVDLASGILARKAEKTETKFDDVLVPLLRTTAKIFVTAFGAVFIADNLSVDITSLLAGLGIGGLAFALAAKDTIENLFGSVTVLVDRPFNIGDWINVDGMDGTVEEIGLRSTRVRTFYNSLITIPNSNLIKAKVDNYGRRKYRRIKTTLSITYNTPPERIEAFCEGIRELIRRHPYTRKDYFHVYLNEFGSSSLDILLYCFVETPDWSTELRERHRLFADIIRLAHRLGVEFAFPTQTLYLERGTGPAQPSPEPFTHAKEVDTRHAEGREYAREIVRSLLLESGRPYPPPPVDFHIPELDPELHPESRRAGGSSAESGDG